MTDKIKIGEELKIALDNRSFEIQLFWQRSNYFLVLMTALGIATFTVKDVYLSPIVAFFAFVCSIFWFKVALGSKFWQESWEVEVGRLSKEYGVRSFERPTSEVIAQVSNALSSAHAGEKNSKLRQWVNRQTIEKPSVTYHMILLALFSSLVWAFVFTVFLSRFINHVCSFEAGCLKCAFPT